ncbi:MAG: hypothetical protein ACRD1K_08935 [Acidimicrobiales bacterium]
MVRLSTPGRRDQRGVAALELALMFTALCLLALLLAPVPYAMLAKIKLERAAGQAARFASQVPDRSRPGLPAGQRRPTTAEIAAEAVASYGGPGTLAPTVVTVFTESSCPRNKATTVAMETSVGLGVFAPLYRVSGLAPASTVTLSASVTNCQE